MKDEHDKSTVDGLSAFDHLHHVPQGRGADAMEADIPSVAALPAKILMERDYRQRQGLITFLPVSMVAMEWGVSARRIRALLCAGRLEGTRHENGYWDVHYPYTMTMGRRGPQLRKYGSKKPERRAA
ncbi:MAG: hypothetical protein Q8O64_11280 [Sideroxyarcus sp.]|nr:hypothetical protein [Sideroxyarcus sp.]